METSVESIAGIIGQGDRLLFRPERSDRSQRAEGLPCVHVDELAEFLLLKMNEPERYAPLHAKSASCPSDP